MYIKKQKQESDMEIYLVRHGETLWNKEKRLQGCSDVELNESGIYLAKETGKNLKKVTFDAVYASPLKRAYQTAERMMEGRPISVIQDKRIREISFGVLEGKSIEQMTEQEKQCVNQFFDAPQCYIPAEGGEQIEDAVKRAADFMKNEIEPLEKKGMKRVMIVAHGAINKAIMMYIKQHGKEDFWSGGLQKNCNIMIIDYTNNCYQVISEENLFY